MSEVIEEIAEENIEVVEEKRKFYVQLNEENGKQYFSGNWSTIGNMPNAVEVAELPPTSKNAKCYYLEDGVWTLDEDKENVMIAEKEARMDLINTQRNIAMSKKELSDSDYKVLKCAEEAIKKLLSIYPDLELPYNFESLCEERQSERDNINELES